MDKIKKMPIIPLRGFLIFPNMIINFDVSRKKSIKAIEKAMVDDQIIFLGVQKDVHKEKPKQDDIYEFGTLAKIKQIIKLPANNVRILVEGLNRSKIINYYEDSSFDLVEVTEKSDEEFYDNDKEALLRVAKETMEDYSNEIKTIASDTIMNIIECEEIGEMADAIASNIQLNFNQKLLLLENGNSALRLKEIIGILVNEIEISKIQKEIKSKVKAKIDKSQKEYFMKEQIKVLEESLGEDYGVQGEINQYKKKLKKIKPPKYIKQKVEKELSRLLKIPVSSAEGSVVRNYIECLLELPWGKYDEENYDLEKAIEILNEEHSGLSKVKERIIEYLAVRKLTQKGESPILCLVGPPGVGKTSIASSIAKSINRQYVRISLGGVKDESEIRGHRRTYIGSMPGRIINAYKQCQTNNPVMLLDEIDKMSSDLRGDPTAALLEVLDAEQNSSFIDHFVEVPYDLSDTLFIATANTLQTVPRPLLDRLEIIELASYTGEEKFNIAKDHLISKQIEKNGLKPKEVRFNDESIKYIINSYTKEAGVRNLERKIGDVCRKSAKLILTEGRSYININKKSVEGFLGIPIYSYDKINSKSYVGIARGLAWTSVGGDTLSIEVNIMNGSGKFELTGQLGDVMKESARAAISYIRSREEKLKVEKDFYKSKDIHIHIPEGAVPKDGPSAGITMATAMISALANIPVSNEVAMTGEITIRGRVLPIGGLKEKLLAAKRAGIKKVLVPFDNKRNVQEIEETILEGLQIVFVKGMDEVLSHALLNEEVSK